MKTCKTYGQTFEVSHNCPGLRINPNPGNFPEPIESDPSKVRLSIEAFNHIRKLAEDIKRYDSDTTLDQLLGLYQAGYLEGVKNK